MIKIIDIIREKKVMINLNYKTPRKHLNDTPKSGKEL